MIHCLAFRHAPTDWNEQELIQGHTDIPLNQNGKEVAYTKKKEIFINNKIDIVFSSDLKRAYQTAKIIFPDKKIHKTKLLREINFGTLDGENSWQVRKNFPFFNRVLNNPKHPLHLFTPFPEGEATIESIMRFIRFLIKIEENHSSKTVALFTHCDLLETLFEINNIPIPKIDFVSKIEFDFNSETMNFSNFKY